MVHGIFGAMSTHPILNKRRSLLIAGLILATSLAGLPLPAGLRTAAAPIPDQLSDQQFWKISSESSEPDGDFRSDNLLSNETTFQYVIPELLQTTRRGGVYLGVGPEQNFSYIAALQPRIAFIVDIRRGNLLEHMLYKALMEMYDNRADFLSHLFARPRPPGLDSNSSAETLFAAYGTVRADSMLWERTLAAVRNHLLKDHGFGLSEEDFSGPQGLIHVYDAFYRAGPEINYNFSSGGGGFGRGMPNYATLMVQTDGAGAHRSYLASEALFRTLRDLEIKNLLVPLVGDFAGAKALRSVGQYLKDHGVTVTAFYTSNVEQYLFQDPDNWRRFYANVGTLPIDASSTFIRSVGGGGLGRGGFGMGGSRLCSIADLLKAYAEGRINFYQDVIGMSH